MNSICYVRVATALNYFVNGGELSMAYKVIQVGAGNHGAQWCGEFLPPNIHEGLIEVVAIVDINASSLQNAKNSLGLRDEQCYTDMYQAFAEVKADLCVNVVPPAIHEQVVDAALAHDLHILSEKPIADTLEGAIRIVD